MVVDGKVAPFGVQAPACLRAFLKKPRTFPSTFVDDRRQMLSQGRFSLLLTELYATPETSVYATFRKHPVCPRTRSVRSHAVQSSNHHVQHGQKKPAPPKTRKYSEHKYIWGQICAEHPMKLLWGFTFLMPFGQWPLPPLLYHDNGSLACYFLQLQLAP